MANNARPPLRYLWEEQMSSLQVSATCKLHWKKDGIYSDSDLPERRQIGTHCCAKLLKKNGDVYA